MKGKKWLVAITFVFISFFALTGCDFGGSEVEETKYTITYNDADGNVVKYQTVKSGEAAEEYTLKSYYEGDEYEYVFKCWIDKESEKLANLTNINSDLTVCPIFEKVKREYTITYGEGAVVIVNGKVISSGDKVKYGSKATFKFDGKMHRAININGVKYLITEVNATVTGNVVVEVEQPTVNEVALSKGSYGFMVYKEDTESYDNLYSQDSVNNFIYIDTDTQKADIMTDLIPGEYQLFEKVPYERVGNTISVTLGGQSLSLNILSNNVLSFTREGEVCYFFLTSEFDFEKTHYDVQSGYTHTPLHVGGTDVYLKSFDVDKTNEKLTLNMNLCSDNSAMTMVYNYKFYGGIIYITEENGDMLLRARMEKRFDACAMSGGYTAEENVLPDIYFE